MTYYVMQCEGVYPAIAIMKEPDLGAPWYYGTKIEGEVPNPLVFGCEKKRDEKGTLKHLYGENAIPIMSTELRKTLTGAGVDNIEYFPAEVHDPKTKQKYTDYFAFNIIGAVGAADMGKSKVSRPTPSLTLNVGFESLTIDPKAARGLLLFRLMQNLGTIIVAERIRNAVEKSGIPGMMFYAPEDWAA